MKKLLDFIVALAPFLAAGVTLGHAFSRDWSAATFFLVLYAVLTRDDVVVSVNTYKEKP